MNRRVFLLSAAGAATVGALGVSIAPARADELGDVLAQITRERASLKSLTAKFTQERTMGLLATTITSHGSMILVRPDRLRWELAPPDAATYWISPKGLSYAMPHSKGSVPRGSVEAFGAVLTDLLVLLGGDLSGLRARYDLTVKRDGAGLELLAKPKSEDVKKRVKSLKMTAGPELWRVKSFTIEEPSGDDSVITFTDIVRDAPIDMKKMEPPA